MYKRRKDTTPMWVRTLFKHLISIEDMSLPYKPPPNRNLKRYGRKTPTQKVKTMFSVAKHKMR